MLGMILGRCPARLCCSDMKEHRLHRRACRLPLKSGPMKFLSQPLDGIRRARPRSGRRKPAILFYPAMKQLDAFDLARDFFSAADIGPEVDEVTKRLCRHGGGIGCRDPQPLPFTQMGRRRQRRERIVAFLEQIPIRRDKAAKICFFGILLQGLPMKMAPLISTQDISITWSFLMMAAPRYANLVADIV